MIDTMPEVQRTFPSVLQPSLPGDACKCGLPYQQDGYVPSHTCTIHYYGLAPAQCNVMKLQCCNQSGDCDIIFDDYHSHGLFNYTQHNVFSLKLLYHAVNAWEERGVSLSTYYAAMYKPAARAYHSSEHAAAACSKSTFDRAYKAFIQKLDAEYCFMCPLCKDSPAILVCDGVSVTIKADAYSGKPIHEPCSNPTCTAGKVERPHSRDGRMFTADAVLLKAFDGPRAGSQVC